MSNLIANTLSLFFKFNNIFPVTVLVLLVLSFVLTGIYLNKRILLLLIAITIQFIISLLIIDSEATIAFIQAFYIISVPALLISSKPFDFTSALKHMQIIGLLCLPYFIHIINSNFSIYDSGNLMGIGYSILPVLISSMIIIFTKFNDKWKYISIFNLIVVIFASSQIISRGYFMSAFICLFALLVYKLIKKPAFMIRTLVFSLVIFLPLVIISLKPIKTSQVYFNLIELKSSDPLNGREDDLGNIVRFRPINQVVFGSGVGSYYRDYGALYIHNLFGMTYYELGVTYLFVLLAIFYLSIRSLLVSAVDNKVKLLILFFLCTSLIRLSVSYYFWIDQIFWAFIAYSICNFSYISNRNYNKPEANVA